MDAMTNAEVLSIMTISIVFQIGRRGFQRGRNRRLRSLWATIKKPRHKNDRHTRAGKRAFRTPPSAMPTCNSPALYRADRTLTLFSYDRRSQETLLETRSDAANNAKITRATKAIEEWFSTDSELQHNRLPFAKPLATRMLSTNFAASDRRFRLEQPADLKLRSRYFRVILTHHDDGVRQGSGKQCCGNG
jgi:hypothetical protein